MYICLGESVKFNIEGLSSLKKLQLEAMIEEVDLSIKNLPSLTNLSLSIAGSINDDIVTRLFDQVHHIQELHLQGRFSYFNLNNFVNLRILSLLGSINEKFNFELFKNLCYQLEDIRIRIYNIKHEKTFFKLFDAYKFPYLVDLTIEYLYINRLKQEFINRLPIHRH